MPCLPHRQSVLGKQQNYSVAFLELPVAQRLDGKNLHLDTAKLIKPEKHATDFSKMTPSRYNVEQGRHTTTLNKTSSFLLSAWQACRQKLQQFFLEQQAKRGTAPGSDGTPTLFPKLIDRVQSLVLNWRLGSNQLTRLAKWRRCSRRRSRRKVAPSLG